MTNQYHNLGWLLITLSSYLISSSNEGDIVLDAFAGSGTTLATAEKIT